MKNKNLKIRREDTVGFGLSFLDVLSCGLGASILLLLVIPRGLADITADPPQNFAHRQAEIQQRLDYKLNEKFELESRVDTSQQELAAAVDERSAVSESQIQERNNLMEELQRLSQSRDELSVAKEEVTRLQLQREQALAAAQSLAEQGQGAKGQLGGIQIAEDRVVILLDRSASMLDHSLIEILRLKVADPRYRDRAPKWVSARNTVNWAFKGIPFGKQYQFLSFSEEVADHNGTILPSNTKLEWLKVGDTGHTLSDLRSSVSALEADGPTNLESAFKMMTTLDPTPRQVILITDGLPSVPGSSRLIRVTGCRTAIGANPLLSPECRRNIFLRAVRLFQQEMPNTQMNVILFPLEGDAGAMRQYWNFASDTGGRVLSPASGWPPP